MLWEIKYLMGQKAIDIYICNAFGGFCPIIEVIIKIKTITTCGQNPCKIVKCFFNNFQFSNLFFKRMDYGV